MNEIWIAGSVLLAALLVAGSIIDARTLRLPDWVTLPLMVAGLLMSWLAGGWSGAASGLAGAAVGYVSLWVVGEFYFRWRSREGLGQGDAKLLGAAGAWLGPAALAPVLLVAAVLALVFVACVRASGRAIAGSTAVPFGPFLSIGFAGAWGATILGLR